MILGMQVTIPGPENFTMPEFQPLWAWIAVAAGVWYFVVVLCMRFGGRGQRIYNEWKDHEFSENHVFDFIHKPGLPAVMARLMISPVEYLAWIPAKNAAWIASLPFVGIANFAKGSPPKPKADKEPQTIFEALEQQNKDMKAEVERLTALMGSANSNITMGKIPAVNSANFIPTITKS